MSLRGSQGAVVIGRVLVPSSTIYIICVIVIMNQWPCDCWQTLFCVCIVTFLCIFLARDTSEFLKNLHEITSIHDRLQSSTKGWCWTFFELHLPRYSISLIFSENGKIFCLTNLRVLSKVVNKSYCAPWCIIPKVVHNAANGTQMSLFSYVMVHTDT